MASKTQRFRALIGADGIPIQPGVYDGFSARLVQQMGFRSAQGFGTIIKDMEQRFLTAAQQAKYGPGIARAT